MEGFNVYLNHSGRCHWDKQRCQPPRGYQVTKAISPFHVSTPPVYSGSQHTTPQLPNPRISQSWTSSAFRYWDQQQRAGSHGNGSNGTTKGEGVRWAYVPDESSHERSCNGRIHNLNRTARREWVSLGEPFRRKVEERATRLSEFPDFGTLRRGKHVRERTTS